MVPRSRGSSLSVNGLLVRISARVLLQFQQVLPESAVINEVVRPLSFTGHLRGLMVRISARVLLQFQQVLSGFAIFLMSGRI